MQKFCSQRGSKECNLTTTTPEIEAKMIKYRNRTGAFCAVLQITLSQSGLAVVASRRILSNTIIGNYVPTSEAQSLNESCGSGPRAHQVGNGHDGQAAREVERWIADEYRRKKIVMKAFRKFCLAQMIAIITMGIFLLISVYLVPIIFQKDGPKVCALENSQNASVASICGRQGQCNDLGECACTVLADGDKCEFFNVPFAIAIAMLTAMVAWNLKTMYNIFCRHDLGAQPPAPVVVKNKKKKKKKKKERESDTGNNGEMGTPAVKSRQLSTGFLLAKRAEYFA